MGTLRFWALITVHVFTLPLHAVLAEGIHPGTVHTDEAVSSVSDEGNSSGAYRIYEREDILERLNADSRYTAIVGKARNMVAPFLSMSESELRGLILPADTIRAFMVNRSGCPVHGGGTQVYAPFGISIDLEHPGTVLCPIGGERYPNSEFPDNGSGWLDNRPDSPTKGQRFYFKGWFQHWFLKNTGVFLKTMAQLWLITGEDVYRKQALILLERFAEVYPDIDSNDLTYSGDDWGVYVKTTGSYWEGTTLLEIAEAVEIFHADMPRQLLDTVHENIYRAAFRAYRAKPASSNWGNNWNPPLAKFATVLGDTEMLDFMMNGHPAAEAPVLDNQFFRDGFPFEASLSYASTYHNVAMRVSEAMNRQGAWVWENPHMRESWHSFAEIVCLDRFTHFAADMGSPVNNGWTLPVSGIERAYLAYRTPELARYLLQSMDVNGIDGPRSLDELFHEPLDMEELKAAAASAPSMKSTTAAVRGIAVLRSGEGGNRSALVMDYGYAHSAHSHADRLNINLFAQGREFIPEMGYPEYMDGIAPATGGWTTNTVCHATVAVDEKRQARGVFGDLHALADLEGLKYIDASCEDAYVHLGIDMYRRTMALIDTPGGAYAVDIFRISGGKRHDFLFHGPAVDVRMENITLPQPRPGTLAGEDIGFGENPRGLKSYDIDNNGYQYLYDVREADISSLYSARWSIGDTLRFKAHFLPDGNETVLLTQGYPRPSSKSLPPMPFIVRRHDARAENTATTFVSVLSVEKGMPLITNVERIELSDEFRGNAVALRITHSYGEDILLSTTEEDGVAKTADGVYELNGMLGVVSVRNNSDSKLSLVGGTAFRAGNDTVSLESPAFKGAIKDVYDDRFTLDRPVPSYRSGTLMFVNRGNVRSVYRLGAVDGSSAAISPSPWIGKGIAGSVDREAMAIIDGRPVYPLGQDDFGERNYYDGAWIVSADGAHCHKLIGGGNDGFFIDRDKTREIARSFDKGSTFLLYDAGPGDMVEILNSRQLSTGHR